MDSKASCGCEARPGLPRRLIDSECTCYIVRCRLHEAAETLLKACIAAKTAIQNLEVNKVQIEELSDAYICLCVAITKAGS